MDVKAIQEALIREGYSVGSAGADGILGRNTINAVERFQRDRGLDIKNFGTIGPKTLFALGVLEAADTQIPVTVTPPWILEARRWFGMHEIRDNKALGKVLKFNPAEIPWCGAFIQAMIATTLPREPMPANPLWARNWLKFGVGIPKDQPILGAIAVFERPGGGGHVTNAVGHDATHIHGLGGNQSNMVTVSRIAKSRLLGLRYPSTFSSRGPVMPMTKIDATVTANEA